MADDFMDYMLLLDDDEEDEPKSGARSGCGCLPMLSIVGLLMVLLLVICH